MPFDLQPVLTGETIELRPLREEDVTALFAAAADPLIWEQHPEPDRWTEPVFRAFFRGAIDSGGALVVVDRDDGRIIGSSRFAGYDEEKSEIEIGWTFLARSHWGGARNREMKRLMLGHAFRFVRRVYFRVGPHNLRSRRALEKIGAVYLGLQADPRRGESAVYEITRNTDQSSKPLASAERNAISVRPPLLRFSV
jgi:RimJ/RimL family protein N-acetyltransferase